MSLYSSNCRLYRSVNPVDPAVELSDVRDFLRVDSTDDDAEILRMIESATREAERLTQLQMISATHVLTMDYFPRWEIRLNIMPVQSVDSITYVDTGGTTQTLASTEYTTQLNHNPPFITPSYGNTWPGERNQAGSVNITITTGYGDTSADVPELAKSLIKTIVMRDYSGLFGDPRITDAIYHYTDQLRWDYPI